MAADTAALTPSSRFTRSRLAFRRWRRNRPFWGGFFMILSGVVLFFSGNLQPTNFQIHLGVTGFLSYIVPAFVLLCGVLAWATPGQRMFYGILGVIAALYSLISVNLGGFVFGMIFGVVGGALTVAWVPIKRALVMVPVQREGDDGTGYGTGYDAGTGYGDGTGHGDGTSHGDGYGTGNGEAGLDVPAPGLEPDSETTATTEIGDPAGAHSVRGNEETPAEETTDGGPEGKQGARFPRPRHATPSSDDAGGLARSTSDVPARIRLPRFAIVGLIVLTFVGTVGVVTLRNAAPAAAASCTPTTLTQLVQSAKQKQSAPGASKSGTAGKGSTGKGSSSKGSTSKSSGSKASGAKTTVGSVAKRLTSKALGDGMLADDGSGSGGIVGGIVGGLGTLLGGGDSSASPSASPAASPSSSAKPIPTSSPKPTPKPTPTTSPKHSTSPSPSGKPSKTATASPTPTGVASSSLPPCPITAKKLAAAANQVTVEETPAIQKTSLLTMTGLSYNGNVDLPTKSGTIKVMEFSMDSSTSTPFELDVTTHGSLMRIKSSKLTVSDNVKFYATEIKGNVLGVLPADYTPDNPPPLVPPLLFFTDVTIGLVDVQCGTLTADNMTVS